MTHARPSQKTITPRAWALMALLALIWGGSFLSNRAAVVAVPVLTIVAFRVLGAAVLLAIYLRARGLALPRSPSWIGRFLVLGLLNNVLPFSFIVWGQGHIASGLAGILNASTAIFTVLLVAIVFPDERLTPRKAFGVALGFAGVVVTIGIAELRHLDPRQLGQLAIIAAAICYALSGAWARAAVKGVRAEVQATGMLMASACVMVPLALWHDGWPGLDYPASAWAGLGYLAVMASAVAYLLFFRVLDIAGAGNLSLVTLLVAPVAIVLGAVVYGEQLSLADYSGFCLIALGLLVLDGRILALPGNAVPREENR